MSNKNAKGSEMPSSAGRFSEADFVLVCTLSNRFFCRFRACSFSAASNTVGCGVGRLFCHKISSSEEKQDVFFDVVTEMTMIFSILFCFATVLTDLCSVSSNTVGCGVEQQPLDHIISSSQGIQYCDTKTTM